MRKSLVLILLSANALYFGWSQGMLAPYGLSPTSGSEPNRVHEQLQPQALQPLGAQEVARLERPAPPECLTSGPWENEQADGLRPALETALPPGSWAFETISPPQRWIVYMGKYPNQETLKRKLAQLAPLRSLKPETPRDPGLQPGISLGRFDSEAAAQAELLRMNGLGVRTAKVVLENEPPATSRLVVPAATSAIRSALLELQPVLQAHRLEPCQ